MSGLKWKWDYSAAKRRYFVVDEEGFTVVGPELSEAAAKKLVRLHNQAIAEDDRDDEAQAAYDAEWGTDNGFAPWDNQPPPSEY